MAANRVTASSLLKNASSAQRARDRAYVEQHEASPILLSPTDVLGNYDAGRLLMTTLGGTVRPITSRDLQAFSKNALTAGQRFRGGITPQGIIDHSRAEDRLRARREIRYAVPARYKDGKIQFVTNAGPDSKVARHFVSVELVNFNAAVASPRTAGQMSDYLTRGKVKIECDCERWRYLFRFIATIGRFNAGFAETGFPKITNPTLTGIACKHVLRVMVALREGQVRTYIGKMIEHSRQAIARRTVPTKQADVQAIIEAQGAGKARIATSAQRQAASKSTARLQAKGKRTIEAVTAKNRTIANKAWLNVVGLLKAGVISQKQADAIAARIKG